MMEYADGGTLAAQITCKPASSVATLTSWLKDCLSALNYYMHDDMGILHRDIKPENICLKRCPIKRGIVQKEYMMVKLVDLGLACVTTSSRGRNTKVGTHAYSSIEKI